MIKSSSIMTLRVEVKVGNEQAGRAEARFLLPASNLTGLRMRLLPEYGTVYLTEQPQMATSFVQSIYLATPDAKVPSSTYIRLRRYVQPTIGRLELKKRERFMLEMKDRVTKEGKQVKSQVPVTLEEILDPKRQKELFSGALDEVGGVNLVPLVAVEIAREYVKHNPRCEFVRMHAADLTTPYISIDKRFCVWGFYTGNNNGVADFSGKELRPESDVVRVELKGFDEQEAAKLKERILCVSGATEADPRYQEELLRGRFVEGLKAR